MSQAERASNIAMAVVVMCTVALTATSLYRTFVGTTATASPVASTTVQLKPAALWSEAVSAGHAFGPAGTNRTIVVFNDFECPACKIFEERTLPSLQEAHGDSIRVVFRHWPLSGHEHAYSLARAAECAAAQGRFREFSAAAYSKQRYIGLISVSTLADSAGIPDQAAFAKCASRTEPVDAIERDVRLVERIGGTGTPTILVNGVLLRGNFSETLIDSLLRATQ